MSRDGQNLSGIAHYQPRFLALQSPLVKRDLRL